MNLFTSGKIVNYSREKRYLLDHAQYITKKIDCFEQRYDYHFGKDANVNINSDEGDHVWQNSGKQKKKVVIDSSNRLEIWFRVMGGIEILAPTTEDEIVECFLSIVRDGLKYFNSTGI